MLAALEYGEGEPVILLHGLLGSKVNMAGTARYLGQKFRAIGIDLRNHGDSFHHGSMNYRIMAADIGGFMDDNDIETAALIGHSMGGKCAMQFALSFPDRVDKLVVVDIAPRKYENPFWVSYIEAMLSVEPTTVKSRKEADELLKELITSPVYRQFLLSNLVSDDHGAFCWRPNLKAILAARDEIAAAVSGPSAPTETLFIRGSDSTHIQEKDSELIGELFPRWDLVTVEGCGHLVHIEARDRFNQLLMDFL